MDKLRYIGGIALVLAASGCSALPQISHQPTFHNPFPQLSRVAIAPFFNLSNEPTLDGRKVAMAYFNELQSVPGFEVVPVGVVEAAMREHQISLHGPGDARRLAQILDVDALVVGAVSDYSPYYPPRMALQVEWYAANPGFHPIPPGYGLPWGTPEAEEIPGPLVFEAEMALARAQLKTQTPEYEKDLGPVSDGRPIQLSPNVQGGPGGGLHGNRDPRLQLPASSMAPASPPPPPPAMPPPSPNVPAPPSENAANGVSAVGEQTTAATPSNTAKPAASDGANTAREHSGGEAQQRASSTARDTSRARQADGVPGTVTATSHETAVPPGAVNDQPPPGFPPNWPDPRGFIPPPPVQRPPMCWPSDAPVIRHTRTYNGNDADFTEALSSYYYFRNDARFGGWQTYLQRSDDFIRFCCYMHVAETLTARGGAGETRVVWRWPRVR